MKKTFLVLGLASSLLVACGKTDKTEKSKTSPSGNDFSTTLPILQEKPDPANETLAVLSAVERQATNPTPPAEESQKGHKMHAANNGVAERDENGTIKEYYRYYDVPTSWTINKDNTEDETYSVVYDVKEGPATFMVQIYNLNAYNKSPLEEGVNMNAQELEGRMAEAHHQFIEKGLVTIEGQEWQVGRQLMTEQKMARLTFYRMESTASYDDSVVVGSIYYPLDPGYDKDRAALKQAISHLKDVVYQMAKK